MPRVARTRVPPIRYSPESNGGDPPEVQQFTYTFAVLDALSDVYYGYFPLWWLIVLFAGVGLPLGYIITGVKNHWIPYSTTTIIAALYVSIFALHKLATFGGLRAGRRGRPYRRLRALLEPIAAHPLAFAASVAAVAAGEHYDVV